ncbi:MAG: hypothetical protein DI538_27750, partial [Azospira oryzae]
AGRGPLKRRYRHACMTPPALPRLGPALLLRALAHRPSRAQAPSTPAAPVQHQLAALDAAHIQRFRAALGFTQPGMPLAYAYLLAQRAQLAAMLRPDFGHRIVGLIHVSHRLQQLGPFDEQQPLLLETTIADEAPRPDGAGYVQLQVQISQQGQVVLRCDSRYLSRRGRPRGTAAPSPSAVPQGEWLARWPLAPQAGRRYAALSGDWNPIHLWRWSARLFGLRRPIIHGAHSAARVQAELEARLGRPLRLLEMQFLRPLPLGSTPALHADIAARRFELLDGDRCVASGQWAL